MTELFCKWWNKCIMKRFHWKSIQKWIHIGFFCWNLHFPCNRDQWQTSLIHNYSIASHWNRNLKAPNYAFEKKRYRNAYKGWNLKKKRKKTMFRWKDNLPWTITRPFVNELSIQILPFDSKWTHFEWLFLLLFECISIVNYYLALYLLDPIRTISAFSIRHSCCHSDFIFRMKGFQSLKSLKHNLRYRIERLNGTERT